MRFLNYNKISTRYNTPLALVFGDIWGPTPVVSIEGFKYYVNFIDAMSSFNWVYPMINKSEVFKIFKNMVER